MMLWLAGLDGIPKSFLRQQGGRSRFLAELFPYCSAGAGSTAFLVLVLSVINSFKVFREAYLISGDYPHESILCSSTCLTIGLYPWTFRR